MNFQSTIRNKRDMRSFGRCSILSNQAENHTGLVEIVDKSLTNTGAVFITKPTVVTQSIRVIGVFQWNLWEAFPEWFTRFICIFWFILPDSIFVFLLRWPKLLLSALLPTPAILNTFFFACCFLETVQGATLTRKQRFSSFWITSILQNFQACHLLSLVIPEAAGISVAVSTEQTECCFVIWEAAGVNDDISKCWFVWSSYGFYLFQGKLLSLRMA